jgi:hypothetical protein
VITNQLRVSKPASQKQFDFIKKLLSEREVDERLDLQVQYNRNLAIVGRLSSSAASELITMLLDAPKKAAPAPAAAPQRDLQPGIYRHGETLFRVYMGQQSGHLLVKRVVNDEGSIGYAYLGNAQRSLPTSAVRLSVDEVGALGKTFDHCLMCGRRLDDPESVDRGIGPVCASKY